MPSGARGVVDVPEIAGDNAMYERAVFDEHRSSLEDGFWEVEMNHELQAQGRRLVTARSARAELVAGFPLALMTRQRFAHGRHFGAGRVWALGEAVGALRRSGGTRQAPGLEAACAHRN